MLIDALGLKFGGRDEAEITDIFALSAEDMVKHNFADPAKAPDYGTIDDAALEDVARDREAAVLYGWRPFMHNPSLVHWLHRANVPSLVVWEKDRVVKPAYGAHLTQRLQNATFHPIAAAGHYPQIEQPDAVVKAIETFAKESDVVQFIHPGAGRGPCFNRSCGGHRVPAFAGMVPYKIEHPRTSPMMHTWHFSEMAYHPAWAQLNESYRVIIPSRLYDPKIGADLYHRYLDEWALCDELGINIMTNEHHATATCANSVCTIPMAILARETKKVRLLALGMPIANRENPIRVAEEYSMLDVISRGRIEMGFVRACRSRFRRPTPTPPT